ncbi:hypothetical protein G7009_24600 [Pseudomonas capeferrum]|uniref:dermonecrotic toxin domain-containing protein n=1 Tax=Pseudomonas capeferrum TaxID=1495066 RepID=UPI0015E382E6|nr:DUF6543 domain-containing protein [Pseudomonas capeferrum]MBA1204901.1 hypothetical protein [Pseudomonas capeferrum]
MSQRATIPRPLDYKQAVAAQFAGRPTLRQVAGREIMQVLIEHRPLIASARPEMRSAEPLYLMVPMSGAWKPLPLVQVVLQSMLDGIPLDFADVDGLDHYLSLTPPHRFYAIEDAGSTADGDAIKLHMLTEAFNDLVLLLTDYFAQAQVEYWASPSNVGVSRDRWLQQTLKSALLHNLPLQGLDDQQLASVHGLLRGGAARPSVFMVQARLETHGQPFIETLPELLVHAEWDERQTFLWLSASGVIKAFDSLSVFATSLRDELAERYRFDAMSWDRHELEGDVFAQQVAVLFDLMLDSGRRLRRLQLTNVETMERALHSLSDPARWFIEGYAVDVDDNVRQPPGVQAARGADSFAYQCGLFDLALAQAESKGKAALDGVLDLHSYASQRLREQMLDDHPDDANYFSDDLILTLSVARGIPGGAGAGAGGGVVETRTMSLTQFAIGNLSSLQGANVTGITHRNEQLIMDWMNVDYVTSLIQQVDIGGSYPTYVAQKLDEPLRRSQRIQLFAREWRCSLLFAALSARLAGTVSEAGLQCVVNYCRGDIDPRQPAIMLMPLAFRREPQTMNHDQVLGMYVLFSAEPSCVMLYRPLYASAPVMEFSSLQALMARIREDQSLQRSIVDWLPSQARSVYDHGGFSEPHLMHPILDTTLFPEGVEPPSFAAQFWRIDVDTKLYMANRDLLVELASRQSVSNAQSRWTILVQGAWLLFDLVTLQLRGPVAAVAWLVQALNGIDNDLSAIKQGNEFERSAAVVDLILNLGMAIMHARLPHIASPEYLQLPDAAVFEGPAARPGADAGIHAVQPEQGKVYLPAALDGSFGARLDFSWRAAQGFNVLPPERRKALLAMRVDRVLDGQERMGSGPGKGTVLVENRHYVTLGGDTYPAEVTAQGVRIVDKEGQPGPWLTLDKGAWRIDSQLRLAGGMPKSRVRAMREQNMQQFTALKDQEERITREFNELSTWFEQHRILLTEKDEAIKKLEANPVPDESDDAVLKLSEALRARIHQRVVKDMRALIDKGFEHDQVLSKIADIRISDPAMAQTITNQRSATRQQLLETCESYYNEMANLINNDEAEKLAGAVMIRPESEQERSHYKAFVDALEVVVERELDLIDLSRSFDQLLESTYRDDSLHFTNFEGTARIKKDDYLLPLIKGRQTSAIDLEFRLLVDLAELCLDRTAGADEKTLQEFYDYLSGDSLKSAGEAHGDLASSNLSLKEQIDVLSGVLEAYEEASVLAGYLKVLGGLAIRQDKLKRYVETLESLKAAAEKDLAMNLREQELQEPRLSRPVLYSARSGKRRVVKTQRGRSVVAEEVEVDGIAVVQQRDRRTNSVLKTFHKKGAEWVEDDVAAEVHEVAEQSSSAVRTRATTMIGQVESIIKLARLYSASDEPIGLSSVIDGHVEKLQEAKTTLTRAAPGDELVDDLDGSIERLRNARRDLLTNLYFVTSHPTAESLRFLLGEGEVTIRRTILRKKLSTSDYLDVYAIERVPKGAGPAAGLWEAHFHYASESTPARGFSKGHLKLWSQRNLGREAQMRAAATGKDLLAIYRGNLHLSQVDGVIPFD